jgi:hypothetical protein
VLNVDRKEWSIPEMMMGTKPVAREGHVACMIGRFLVVSGGYNDHGRLFDAHVLDTDTMVWEALDTSLNQVRIRTCVCALVGLKRSESEGEHPVMTSTLCSS